MKIAVQGNIIDTENIYCIGEIKKTFSDEKGANVFKFLIESFNDKTIEVSIIRQEGLKELFDSEGYPDTREERLEKTFAVEDANKAKLEKMRQAIIDIWSQNQSKIPTFDIKNF